MSIIRRLQATISAGLDNAVSQVENHDAVVEAALKDARTAAARARVRLARVQKEEETLIVLNGMLSKLSNSEFQRKLKRLSKEFNDLNNEDASLDIIDRNGVTLVLAMRTWEFGIFKPMRRNV